MATIPHRETDYFYNVAEPGIIVGDEAYQHAIETGAHPADLVSLTDLLTGTVDSSETHQPLDVNDWDHNMYLAFGRWLITTVDAPLRHRIIQNAYKLGLGPEPQRIYRKDPILGRPRFHGYRDFYEQLDAKDTIRKGTYDTLSFADLMKHVKKHADHAAATGIRPTVGLFEQLAKDYKGPSDTTVRRMTGVSYGKLLDMAGYPEPRNWTNDDYLEWGVKFMRANQGRLPYYGGIKELSGRFRGPSDVSIARRFGGIWSFQTAVEEQYQAYIDAQQEEENRKLTAIKHELEIGTMPEALFEDCDPPTALRRAAQYWVSRHFFPAMSQERLLRLASTDMISRFVQKIRQNNTALNLAHIEVAASELGVFDDIWPPDNDFMTYLKVST